MFLRFFASGEMIESSEEADDLDFFVVEKIINKVGHKPPCGV